MGQDRNTISTKCNFSVGLVSVESNLLFPVSMSKTILKLNHLYGSSISVNSIFTHPNLIVSM